MGVTGKAPIFTITNENLTLNFYTSFAMKNTQNKALFDKAIKIAQKGEDLTDAIPVLMQLREASKEANDPLVTKVLRLASQHIENNGSFDLAQYFEEEPLPDDMSNLEYFLQLVADSDNKFNREELAQFRDILTQLAQ